MMINGNLVLFRNENWYVLHINSTPYLMCRIWILNLRKKTLIIGTTSIIFLLICPYLSLNLSRACNLDIVVVQLGLRLQPFFFCVCEISHKWCEREKKFFYKILFLKKILAIFRDILKTIHPILTYFSVLEHILSHFNNVKHYCLLMRYFSWDAYN
jgi:hypothetical protein